MFFSQETCRYLSTGDSQHAAGSAMGGADGFLITWNWSYSIEGAMLLVSVALFTVSGKGFFIEEAKKYS